MFNIGDYYFTFPTQIIEATYDFLILHIFLKYEKEGIARGFFYPKLLLLYGGGRFFIEFLRSTDKDWLYLSHAQWFSIISLIIGVVFEIIFIKQKRDTMNQNPPLNEEHMSADGFATTSGERNV